MLVGLEVRNLNDPSSEFDLTVHVHRLFVLDANSLKEVFVNSNQGQQSAIDSILSNKNT